MGKHTTINKIMRQKVVNFARNHLGTKVGSGECTDLVARALKKAGAKSARDFVTHLTPNGNYIWGKKITLKQVKPGDILQLRNHKIKFKILTITKKTTRFGGSKTTKVITEEEVERPHHTAIVAENIGNGVMTIYEQNIIPRGKTTLSKKVMKNKFYTKNIVITKTKKIFHIIGGSGTIKTKTIITVSGKIWAYRAIKDENSQKSVSFF